MVIKSTKNNAAEHFTGNILKECLSVAKKMGSEGHQLLNQEQRKMLLDTLFKTPSPLNSCSIKPQVSYLCGKVQPNSYTTYIFWKFDESELVITPHQNDRKFWYKSAKNIDHYDNHSFFSEKMNCSLFELQLISILFAEITLKDVVKLNEVEEHLKVTKDDGKDLYSLQPIDEASENFIIDELFKKISKRTVSNIKRFLSSDGEYSKIRASTVSHANNLLVFPIYFFENKSFFVKSILLDLLETNSEYFNLSATIKDDFSGLNLSIEFNK